MPPRDIRSPRLKSRTIDYFLNWLRRSPASVATYHRGTVCAELLEQRQLLSFAPSGPEFPVNSYTGDAQSEADIAMDDAGNFVVVWQSQGQDGSDAGVYAQLYDTQGATVGPEFRVNSYTTGFQGYPSVAMDGLGNFVVAWSGASQFESSGVVAQRFSSSGTPLGTEISINQYTTGSQSHPSAAMEADGDFVVAWQGAGPSSISTGGDIYARRFDAGGNALGSDFLVNISEPDVLSHPYMYQFPSVAVNASGIFLITWERVDTHSTLFAFAVNARRYGPSGALGNQFGVPTTLTQNSQPDVVVGQTGSFVVTWSNTPDNSSPDIRARRFDSSGTALGNDFLVNTYTTSNQDRPAIDIAPDDSYAITWSSNRQDGQRYGVFAQRFDATGATVGSEFQVNSYTIDDQYAPAIGIDAAGGFVVAWSSDLQDGSIVGVFAQRYENLSPPVVSQGTFHCTTGQWIELGFDQSVTANLPASNLELLNLTSATSIPVGDISISQPDGSHISFAFPTYANGGSLPNGNYRFTLRAAGALNSAGQQMTSDYSMEFYVLAGDANRDRRVDLYDLVALATHWMATGMSAAEGDFNHDGCTDARDLGVLAMNWQQRLDPPPPPAPPMPTSVTTRPATRTPTRLIVPI